MDCESIRAHKTPSAQIYSLATGGGNELLPHIAYIRGGQSAVHEPISKAERVYLGPLIVWAKILTDIVKKEPVLRPFPNSLFVSCPSRAVSAPCAK